MPSFWRQSIAHQLFQWPFLVQDLPALAPPFNVGARFRSHWKGEAHLACVHVANPSILGLLASLPLLLGEGREPGPPVLEQDG